VFRDKLISILFELGCKKEEEERAGWKRMGLRLSEQAERIICVLYKHE
jgi:hypothetical protein